jgi:hypothetical protein
MTQTVDDVLHDLAKRGEISHISLTPNSRGDGWCASFSMCSRFGVSFAEDPDPAQAIIRACTTAKMKPRAAPKHHAVIDAEKFHDAPWSSTDPDLAQEARMNAVEAEAGVPEPETGGVTIDWSTGLPVEPESFDDLM